MATKFIKGQEVQVISVVPKGPVQKLRMDEDGVFWYLLSWEEAGETKERWFREDQLIEV